MSFDVYAEVLETADMTNSLRVFRLLQSTEKNLTVIGFRATLVLYNNPTFTSVSCDIYSVKNGEPDVLLYSSTDSRTKAELLEKDNITYNSGHVETWFEFDQVNLKQGDWYAFVIKAVGYTGSSSSHIALKKDWPDPVVYYGNTPSYFDIVRSPVTGYTIGAEL